MDPLERKPTPAEPATISETLLAGLCIAGGLLPVVGALCRGETWGAEPTLGLLFSLVAAAWLVERHRWGGGHAGARGVCATAAARAGCADAP